MITQWQYSDLMYNIIFVSLHCGWKYGWADHVLSRLSLWIHHFMLITNPICYETSGGHLFYVCTLEEGKDNLHNNRRWAGKTSYVHLAPDRGGISTRVRESTLADRDSRKLHVARVHLDSRWKCCMSTWSAHPLSKLTSSTLSKTRHQLFFIIKQFNRLINNNSFKGQSICF